jgi:hypothetical protein
MNLLKSFFVGGSARSNALTTWPPLKKFSAAELSKPHRDGCDELNNVSSFVTAVDIGYRPPPV